MDGPVRDNTQRSRYELEEGGQIAFANYRRVGQVVQIPHVEAAIPLRGTGAASRLMQGVAETARRQGLKVMPICGYARAWFRRHREHQDLLA